MGRATGHILKSNNVKFEGQFQLDAVQSEPNSSGEERNAASAPPQVRIVENHPEFAVIEITCSCGTKTYLKCEYPSIKPSPEESKPSLQDTANETSPQTQNGATDVPDQVSDQTE